MAIIQHEFNGTLISQASDNTQFGAYTVPRGYVNLTDMCKTNPKKKLADYLRLSTTKEYLIELENDIKQNTIVFVEGYGSIQSTWGHIQVADNLLQWLKRPITKKSIEQEAQLKLLESLHNGRIEVDTPVGKIDILTPTELIEVKEIKKWKSALGQVIAYGYFYPRHTKRLHLFGTANYTDRTLFFIEAICKKYNVMVTWE